MLRYSFVDDVGHDADAYACADAGEYQDRKINEHFNIGDHEGRYQELAHVVSHAAGHAYADHGEFPRLHEEPHYDEADDAAGQGIEHGEDAAEQKAAQGDPHEVDGHGIAEIHFVEGYDDDQIGQTQLDAGDADAVWNQKFHVSENQSQGGVHSAHSQAASPLGAFANLRSRHTYRHLPLW